MVTDGVISDHSGSVKGARIACALALVAACQFQPRGADVDASALVDGEVAVDPDAMNAPDPDATDIDAAPTIDARMIDARMIDADACPTACSMCLADGTCVITCGTVACANGVTCPAGRPCQVDCVGTSACDGTVDCSQATRCDVTCSGTSACNSGVVCGGTRCNVTCSGTAACEDRGVECTADVCDITCSGIGSCADGVCCDDSTCSNAGGAGCHSSNGGCCQCGGC
jgi:hypothetical protein